MDREGTSRLVYDNQDDAHDYISKTHHFVLKQAMNDVNSILHERIDDLAIDMH